MYDKLWLIPLLPLIGCIINGLLGKKVIKSEKAIGGIATGLMLLSFLLSSKLLSTCSGLFIVDQDGSAKQR